MKLLRTIALDPSDTFVFDTAAEPGDWAVSGAFRFYDRDPAALAGKTASVLGDPDQPHTYTYIPDIAEGLAVLGEHQDAPGQVWHLPNDPDTRTTRELIDIVYRHAGQPRARLRSLPPLLLRALGLANPVLRELVEMQYQFDEPFIVDSSKIASKLGLVATPIEQALAETLATYRRGERPGVGHDDGASR